MSERPDYVIGIDLGGSSVKAVAVTPAGTTLEKRVIPFDAEIAMDWADVIRAVVANIETQAGSRSLSIGLSAPGLASPDERSIAVMPGRLEGLVGLDWTTYLRRDEPVRVLNDAHAALLGECWLGAAQGRRNVALLTLGTGVGGALLLDGKLFRGHLGRAGHLGHLSVDDQGEKDVTGMPGSIEDAIGNCTIARRTANRFRSTHDLIAATRSGDEVAHGIWIESVRKLAVGIASIINIVDPEIVVVGGGIAAAGDLLFNPLRKMVGEFEWRVATTGVEIVPATQGEIAGALGAGYYSRARA
jgi:glucokinase